MATHDVTLLVPKKFVLAKDVKFRVKSNGKKLGDLLVSKGNIEWVPARKSANKLRLPWEKFDQLMRDQGKMVRMK